MLGSAAASTIAQQSLVPMDRTHPFGPALTPARVPVGVKDTDIHVGTQAEGYSRLHAMEPPSVARGPGEAVHKSGGAHGLTDFTDIDTAQFSDARIINGVADTAVVRSRGAFVAPDPLLTALPQILSALAVGRWSAPAFLQPSSAVFHLRYRLRDTFTASRLRTNAPSGDG